MSKCVHGWRGSSIAETPIVDACPSCGGRSLFIGAGGFLTCSYIPCKEPGIGRWMETARARIAELERDLGYADRINGRLMAQNYRLNLQLIAGDAALRARIAELERDNQSEMQANAALCARLMALEAERDAALSELAELRERKDAAYEERNRVVALLARFYEGSRTKTAIEGWSDDWHGCVYFNTREGQVSWHFHDSQAFLFDGLPVRTIEWDGHTTEEKYARIERICAAIDAAREREKASE